MLLPAGESPLSTDMSTDGIEGGQVEERRSRRGSWRGVWGYGGFIAVMRFVDCPFQEPGRSQRSFDVVVVAARGVLVACCAASEASTLVVLASD